MSAKKKCKLVHPCSSKTLQHRSIDWNLCALCQETSSESLQCPANSKRSDIGAGYKNIENNLKAFGDLGVHPVPVDVCQLDEGDGIANTMTRNSAYWHSSCRLKCSASRLARLQRTSTSSSEDTQAFPYIRRRSNSNSGKSSLILNKCFFCEEPGNDNNPLHEAMTPNLTQRVKHCALKLQDQKLIAQLSSGDLVAQEAKYHSQCLVKLYNASSRKIEEEKETNNDGFSHGVALVELIGYIKETQLTERTVPPVFKLIDLVHMYTSRLQQLGVDISSRIHSTHLKERVLANVPGLRAYKQGRDVLLTFDENVGSLLKDASLDDCDDEALCLAKAANIIRRDLFHKQEKFDLQFEKGCQEDSVPTSLIALVGMIMDGSNITHKNTNKSRQVALSLAQLMKFNSHIRTRKEATTCYHKKDRETPLPIYLGLMIHGHTRKRELVDTLFHLGLSISYDRLLEISTNVAVSASEQYHMDGVVCPFVLRKNLFTTAAVDNIDHNPSSSTSKESFHGTGISLFQNRSAELDGLIREKATYTIERSCKQIPLLPETYTNVTPVTMKNKDPIVPLMAGTLIGDDKPVIAAIQEERKWQSATQERLDNPTQSIAEPISWAAFHSNTQLQNFDATLSSLLPLFPDDSKSVAMIRHSMDIIQQTVKFLNPGQIPIITFDQPLFAIAKHIQWYWPDIYGEQKFVIILGGLHIEMAAWRTVGDLLDGCGWTNALVQAEITTSGIADSFIKATHVTRTRHVHQVTCSALWMLLQKAYATYTRENQDPVTYESWCFQQCETCPHFRYWFTVMQLELLILVYVRSLREANFDLYVSAITALAPWFFALDHIHYSRWMPVHIRDMSTLHQRLPEIAKEFDNGGFVVHKTRRPFSAIAIDQAHEQNNAIVKGDGGAIGLTQNPKALLRWMVAGPEIARLVDDFETLYLDNISRNNDQIRHHDHNLSSQNTFAQETKDLIQVFESMGNPFLENSSELLVLDSRDVADQSVVNTINSIEQIGQDQYHKFVKERLVERSVQINAPLQKNKLQLFNTPAVRNSTKTTQIVSSLKSDCALFSRLYIACQTREGDLDNFFKHENHAYPPSLSVHGKLRLGTKADLTTCLEKLCSTLDNSPDIDDLILDGAAIVNMLRPIGVTTFQEYSTNVFIPYIRRQLQHVRRVDIIWDVYLQSSLKSMTREKRGKGIRRHVAGPITIPAKWNDFLRLDDNKSELFDFLAHQVLENLQTEKEIYTTCGPNVICNHADKEVSSLSPCTHEEADTRIIIHILDAADKGHEKIMVRTVDTDVICLAVCYAVSLENTEIWISFGTGKHLRYIPAHEIANSLGPQKSKALPLFHAFTGCDTVSSFSGRGKKTAFDIWKSYDRVTTAFLELMEYHRLDETSFPEIETFVVLLYDRTSGECSVDEARKQMFTKGRSIDVIPPTKAALIQHTKRAIYQGAIVWGQAHTLEPDLPSPEFWGWKKGSNGGWEPLWTLLSEAAISCSELLQCGCRKGCRGACKCVKASLKCTSLCRCNGNCDYNDQ